MFKKLNCYLILYFYENLEGAISLSVEKPNFYFSLLY